MTPVGWALLISFSWWISAVAVCVEAESKDRELSTLGKLAGLPMLSLVWFTKKATIVSRELSEALFFKQPEEGETE